MVRAALAQNRMIGRGPKTGAHLIPALTVVIASLISALPIISMSGWYPDFAFLVLIGWRLLRSDPWPAWWATMLGLFNDLVTGNPIGLSAALWTATMLALDLADRRTMWRDYWLEWALAGLLVFISETVEWRIAELMSASIPFMTVLPPLLISIFAFPIVAWLIGRIDRWRLGR